MSAEYLMTKRLQTLFLKKVPFWVVRVETKNWKTSLLTLWFNLEDMVQLGMSQGIERVMYQLKDTPKKVYALDVKLFL